MTGRCPGRASGGTGQCEHRQRSIELLEGEFPFGRSLFGQRLLDRATRQALDQLEWWCQQFSTVGSHSPPGSSQTHPDRPEMSALVNDLCRFMKKVVTLRVEMCDHSRRAHSA